MKTCLTCIHNPICEVTGFGDIKTTICQHYCESKQGHWIESWHEESPTFEHGRMMMRKHLVKTCSVCGVAIVGLINMDFCPSCGAKMDGKEKDNNV